MKKDGLISHGELMALAVIGLFSPAIRVPRMAAAFAGRAAWLSPVAAAPVLVIYAAFCAAFIRRRREGEGLSGLFERSLGRLPGRTLIALCGLWLTFYAGFTLRVSGERLISAIYGTGGAWFFMAVEIAAAALIAGDGMTRAVRAAQVFSGVLIAALAVLCLCALTDIDPKNLWPVSRLDAGGIALGAAPFADVIGLSGYYMLLQGRVRKESDGAACMLRRLGGLLAALGAGTAVTVGMLSPRVTAALRYPFFTMIRDISIFGVVERIEAVVVALWVASDMMFFAALLMMCAECAAAISPRAAKKTAVLFAAAAAFAVGLFAFRDAFVLTELSRRVVPAVNLAVTFGLFPAVFAVGRLRKKL